MTQAARALVQVLNRRRDKSVGVHRVNFCGRLADDVAVEERHGFTQSDSADDEGDED